MGHDILYIIIFYILKSFGESILKVLRDKKLIKM